MKKIFPLLLLFIGTTKLMAQQRIIAECTITYSIAAPDTSTDESMVQALKASSKIVYIKGNESRTDLISTAFCQSVIYDKKDGKATILREIGNNKFMTRLTNEKWMMENKRFEGLTIETLDERKTFAGYSCKKAVLHLKDGSSFNLYYTTSIIPSVKEFEYQFKDVAGLVLAYEAYGPKGEKVKYVATKVNLSPVPNGIFKIPTTGYRIL